MAAAIFIWCSNISAGAISRLYIESRTGGSGCGGKTVAASCHRLTEAALFRLYFGEMVLGIPLASKDR
jgi:hypothetical protein